LETEEFTWMVREALWAFFTRIRENSAFGLTLLVLLLDGLPSPGRGLLAKGFFWESKGFQSQKGCRHRSQSHAMGRVGAPPAPRLSMLGGLCRGLQAQRVGKGSSQAGRFEAALQLQVCSWAAAVLRPGFAVCQGPAGENAVLRLIAVAWSQHFPIRYFN